MMARVRGVIFASTSAGSRVYVSSMSAKIGTQLCSSAPMMLPPDVHGETMISSPGSGFTAPMHVCMADVPEFTVITHSTPCLSANALLKPVDDRPPAHVPRPDHLRHRLHVVLAKVMPRPKPSRADRLPSMYRQRTGHVSRPP